MVMGSLCRCFLSVFGVLLFIISHILGVPCDLPEVPNGQLVYARDYTYEDYLAGDPDKSDPGEKVTIVCDYGYELTVPGNGESTCQQHGDWLPPISLCSKKGGSTTAASPTECAVPIIHNANVTRSGTELFSGQKIAAGHFVEVTCNIGYKQTGDAVLTCQDGGQWQGRIPLCTKQASGSTTCKVPNIAKSRIKQLHSLVNAGDVIAVNQEIEVGCNVGYRRFGERYLRCVPGGSWNHPVPECRSSLSFITQAPISKCPLPPILNGAYVAVVPTPGAGTGGGYEYAADYGNYGGYDYDGETTTAPAAGETTTATATASPQSNQHTELAIGATIEVACNSGYTMRGAKQVKCEFDGRLSSVPICISAADPSAASKCPAPLIQDGRIKLVHEFIDPGTLVETNDTITITCDVNMEREGEKVLTCLANGSWNYPSPKCKPQTINAFTPCTLPIIANGGYVVPTSAPGADYDYGGGVDEDPYSLLQGFEKTVFCNQGYKLVGPQTVACYSNLTLSEIPQCQTIRCRVQARPNVLLKLDNSTAPSMVVFNQTIVASCEDGLNLIGADRLTCTEKEDFDGEFPTCMNGTDFCTIPPIANGRSSPLRPGLNTAVRETIKIICPKGYLVNTPSGDMKCGVDRQWVPEVPKCLIAKCRADVTVIDGKVEVDGNPAPKFVEYGTNVTVVCDQGFRLIGDGDSRQCGETGEFNAKLPRCDPEDKSSCRVRLRKDNNTIIETSLNMVRSGHSTKMSCVPGYRPSPAIGRQRELHCDDGIWREKMPICILDEKCTLPTIENGHITVVKIRRDRTNSILVNDKAYVKCDDGYMLQGAGELLCIGVELYDVALPKCLPVGIPLACIIPPVGHGTVVDSNGDEIRDYDVTPHTQIYVRCDVEEETPASSFRCTTHNGMWDPRQVFICKQAPAVSVRNYEAGHDSSNQTIYIIVGVLIAAVVIIALLVAVFLRRRQKQRQMETAPMIDNNIDNMVYLTAMEANGHSNPAMSPGGDDDYLRPKNVNGRPSGDGDIVLRRQSRGQSHVRDSVAADFANERPESVVTVKPAYNRSTKRKTNTPDEDSKV